MKRRTLFKSLGALAGALALPWKSASAAPARTFRYERKIPHRPDLADVMYDISPKDSPFFSADTQLSYSVRGRKYQAGDDDAHVWVTDTLEPKR